MNYRIVDGSDKMKFEDIVRLLRMTYWADKRPIEKIEKSLRNSSCYGIYVEDALSGQRSLIITTGISIERARTAFRHHEVRIIG